MKKIHYSGKIVHARGSVLAGWAACCYGEKAEKIRRERQHSQFVSEVNCKACLKMIAKHDDWAERKAIAESQKAGRDALKDF